MILPLVAKGFEQNEHLGSRPSLGNVFQKLAIKDEETFGEPLPKPRERTFPPRQALPKDASFKFFGPDSKMLGIDRSEGGTRCLLNHPNNFSHESPNGQSDSRVDPEKSYPRCADIDSQSINRSLRTA